MSIRRVVTGVDRSGNSLVVTDTRPDVKLLPTEGIAIADLWAITPSDPSTALGTKTADCTLPIAPASKQIIFRVVEFLPDSAKSNMSQPSPTSPESDNINPGLYFKPHSNGTELHRTNSIDYITVISGKIDLQLENETITLHAGDTAIQNATFHAWKNPYSEACKVSFVMSGFDTNGDN